MNDDFKNENFKSLDIIKIDGPFVIGFDRIQKLYEVFNYDEENFCSIDSDLLLQENYEIGSDNIYINLNFSKGYYYWHFFFFSINKVFIFILEKNNQLALISKGLTFDWGSFKRIVKIL